MFLVDKSWQRSENRTINKFTQQLIKIMRVILSYFRLNIIIIKNEMVFIIYCINDNSYTCRLLYVRKFYSHTLYFD